MTDMADTTQNWRTRTHTQEGENQGYVSPPYTNRRDVRRERNYMRAPFPQRGLSEWRIKTTNLHSGMEQPEQAQDENQRTHRDLPTHKSLHQTQGEQQAEEQVLNELDEATLLYLSCPDPTEAAARKQRVMNGDAKGQREETAAFMLNSHLQDVTKQYLSCTDLIEAAARKQRVLTGDASGLMEEAAASILAVSEFPRRPLSPWERGIRSVSPSAQDNPLNALFLADHTVVLSPQGGEDKEEDTGGDSYYNEASPLQPPASLSTRKTRPQTLKSIIISPSLEGEEESRAPDQQENRTALEKEETLQEFQNKEGTSGVSFQERKQIRQHELHRPHGGRRARVLTEIVWPYGGSCCLNLGCFRVSQAPLSPWERGIDHPQGGEDKEETRGDSYYNEASPQPPASLGTRKTRPQALKSIIISPSLEGEEESRAPDQQENRAALEKEETLQEFQNKKLMYQHESGLFDFRRTESSPLLLVIDKRDDPAMVHELIGLEDNKVDVRAIGSLSKDQQVQVAKSNKNIQTVEDMARFVDSYPEHKKMQGNVSKHVTLVTEMSKLVEARKLMLVSQTEQDLACNGGSWN
ncbi:hypothetical protein Bca52824_074365 [Brassica carinata]|uniref:Uncharacterized protein n=1 Tax=Brassica carinata TaxID=52824 RepID=A0A8X7PNG7_BRACI|nr:hypothetical protein Bca52824_074365 [Brassica carinata]